MSDVIACDRLVSAYCVEKVGRQLFVDFFGVVDIPTNLRSCHGGRLEQSSYRSFVSH